MNDLLKINDYTNCSFRNIGIDSVEECLNIEHYKNYTKEVNYIFNSNGFRDEEWPTNLKNKIWCVGDSFSMGLGQPYDETWPMLLQKKLNERCIRITEDGCSNDLIAMRSQFIINNYKPKLLIVMWSYFWRRFLNGKNIHYVKRQSPKDDLNNFIDNCLLVNQFDKVINFIIPDCFIDDIHIKNASKLIQQNSVKQLPELIEIEQLDYARDGHHFDVRTSERIVEIITDKYIKC